MLFFKMEEGDKGNARRAFFIIGLGLCGVSITLLYYYRGPF